MNLHIQQLAARHALYVDGGQGNTNYTFTKESLDLFVNAVVNECVTVIKDHSANYDHRAMFLVQEMVRMNETAIKNHFGDEE